MNLAQIRSAVPEIFRIQTKRVTDCVINRTLRSSVPAVIMGGFLKMKFGELAEYRPEKSSLNFESLVLGLGLGLVLLLFVGDDTWRCGGTCAVPTI